MPFQQFFWRRPIEWIWILESNRLCGCLETQIGNRCRFQSASGDLHVEARGPLGERAMLAEPRHPTAMVHHFLAATEPSQTGCCATSFLPTDLPPATPTHVS
jgi:hypothetical protein